MNSSIFIELWLFISNTFLFSDMIYSEANQRHTFIFFLSVAICLRWVLIWAGCRSLGLGQNVPWHSGLELQSPSTVTTVHWVTTLPTSWNTSQMSSIHPESQKHKLIPSMLWSLFFPIHLDTCLCLQWTGHDWITAPEIIILLKNFHHLEGLNQSKVTSEHQDSYPHKRQGREKHMYASKFCYLHVLA